MKIEEQSFANLKEAAHALAEELAETLRQAILKKGQAALAVSGGRTPKEVFERLRHLKVNWQRVTITLTDERWVSPDHEDSNEKLVRTHLMQGDAAAIEFIPLFGGESTPETGQGACEARLQKLSLPFDAVYLGMGSDGHFASLFPGDPAVDEQHGLCVAVPAAKDRLPRMSLTAPAILNAGKIYLLFSGAEKHAKYTEAKKPGSPREIPLRLILTQQQTPVYVLSAP